MVSLDEMVHDLFHPMSAVSILPLAAPPRLASPPSYHLSSTSPPSPSPTQLQSQPKTEAEQNTNENCRYLPPTSNISDRVELDLRGRRAYQNRKSNKFSSFFPPLPVLGLLLMPMTSSSSSSEDTPTGWWCCGRSRKAEEGKLNQIFLCFFGKKNGLGF